MRYAGIGAFVLIFMVLGLIQAPRFHLPHGISENVAGAAVALSVYGSGLSADALYNIPLGGSMYGPPYRTKVSWRFRAQHTGLLKSVRPYLIFVDGPGDPGNYSSGNGGTVLVEVQTDDGSASNFPSGTVLAAFLYTTPKMGGILPLITFPAPLPQLQAGVLYHLVFSNTSPDPFNNFVSLNHLWLDRPAPVIPRQPTVSDTDLHTLVQENEGAWADTRFINSTPVFELTYADGFAQGSGYIEVWSGQPIPPISGGDQTRETFTVSGPNRTVSAVSLRVARVSGTDPLTIRLEEDNGLGLDNGTLIEEGAIAASSFPLTDPPTYVWVMYTFIIPRTLTSGQSYNLVQVAPSTSAYQTFPLRKAAENRFNPATYFADGHAQQNDGTGWGWEDWIPATWGVNRPDGDLQFYFMVVQ